MVVRTLFGMIELSALCCVAVLFFRHGWWILWGLWIIFTMVCGMTIVDQAKYVIPYED
jgi:hypothetical protein